MEHLWRPFRRARGRKLVAVVVPTHRRPADGDEQLSLKHLNRHLGRYEKFLAVPNRLRVDWPGFQPVRFGDQHFGTPPGPNRLLLSEAFYQTFSAYQYILIYHLDALVFSDRLVEWCERGYDYIGAPWFKTPRTRFLYDGPERAGNGGFSLRRIDAFLKVIRAAKTFRDRWQTPRDEPPLAIRNTLEKGNFTNEDVFWSFHASGFYPEFYIPPVDVAVSFAFECDPRYCFERNHHQIPFGCHAWALHDRPFWEPYLDSH